MQAGLNIKVKSINKPTDTGFPAIVGDHVKILILGSMPSITSLQQQQYYAHPRNAFWPIMSVLFDMDESWNYAQRCKQLIKNHVAVWDVLKACQRQGSLDNNIETASMVSNNFNLFFKQHPYIEKVLFNGTKAEQIYKQHVLSSLDSQFKTLPQIRLPSTSPAHASLSFEQKLLPWQSALSD